MRKDGSALWFLLFIPSSFSCPRIMSLKSLRPTGPCSVVGTEGLGCDKQGHEEGVQGRLHGSSGAGFHEAQAMCNGNPMM